MNVLITGTSSGIGNGLAKELVNRKNKVWGISRRKAGELSNKQNYHHLQIDLTDYDKVQRQLPEFISGEKSFDLVILNAGILGNIGLMKELDLHEMKKVMETNVWSNKFLLDIILGQVQEVKQVVGMSSKASLRCTPGWGPYSMSKAGLNMLINVYAKEYPETHFSALAPGLVDSEIQEAIWQIKEIEKYPTIKTLQDARYTEAMPGSDAAAPMLIDGMDKALAYESGSYVDVREM